MSIHFLAFARITFKVMSITQVLVLHGIRELEKGDRLLHDTINLHDNALELSGSVWVLVMAVVVRL